MQENVRVFWYKYRDDLWKKVTVPDADWQRFHDRKEDSPDKLENNLRRAQRQIEAYALCNDWEWFGTFTLNAAQRDRGDLDDFRRDFAQYIRDLRKQHGAELKYLLVPELHKRGDGWHMHGFLRGIPSGALRPFTLQEKLPKYLREKIVEGSPVYDWPGYRKRFGFVDVEPIRNRDAAARYVTKYINKDMLTTSKRIGKEKNLYYVSQGLNLPVQWENENAPGSQPEALQGGTVEKTLLYPEYRVMVEWIRPAPWTI